MLRELAVWRERAAAEANLALNIIARDDLLLQLAKQQPTTMAEVMQNPQLKPATLRSAGPALAAGSITACLL